LEAATSLSGRYDHHSNDILDVNGYIDIFRFRCIVHIMDIKNSSRILIDVPRELLRAIEDYRYTERIPSRAEAIRQLIERGLHTTLTDEEAHPDAGTPPG
jgi:hypothetical protein